MGDEKKEKKNSGCFSEAINIFLLGIPIKILTDVFFGSNPKYSWVFPTLLVIMLIVYFYIRDKKNKESKQE